MVGSPADTGPPAVKFAAHMQLAQARTVDCGGAEYHHPVWAAAECALPLYLVLEGGGRNVKLQCAGCAQRRQQAPLHSRHIHHI
jgi:hypothetical protein